MTDTTTRSDKPHIKLRARSESGVNLPVGTAVPGRKPYTMSLILEAQGALPGQSMLGFIANDMDISALGQRGAPLTYYPQDGVAVQVGWISPVNIPVASIDPITGERGSAQPTQCVIVRIDQDAQLQAGEDGKVLVTAINHQLRRELQNAGLL